MHEKMILVLMYPLDEGINVYEYFFCLKDALFKYDLLTKPWRNRNFTEISKGKEKIFFVKGFKVTLKRVKKNENIFLPNS